MTHERRGPHGAARHVLHPHQVLPPCVTGRRPRPQCRRARRPPQGRLRLRHHHVPHPTSTVPARWEASNSTGGLDGPARSCGTRQRTSESAHSYFTTCLRSRPGVVLLNSFFDWRFTILPLMLLRTRRRRHSVILAPRGEACTRKAGAQAIEEAGVHRRLPAASTPSLGGLERLDGVRCS